MLRTFHITTINFDWCSFRVHRIGGGAERLFPDTCRNVLNETSLLSSRRSSQPLSALYVLARTNVRMRKSSCAHAQEFLINMAARCPQGLVHYTLMKLVGALLSSGF